MAKTAKKEEMSSLHDLYVHELKDILSAEKQITKALPKMAKKATNPELKAGFEKHLEETKNQISRLKEIFQRLDESASGPKCEGMEGLLKEGEKMLSEDATPGVLDAGMIVAAQKVEHYEIAAYGSLCTFAKSLGYTEDLQLLKQTLDEEETTDEKLSELAETEVNAQAQEAEAK